MASPRFCSASSLVWTGSDFSDTLLADLRVRGVGVEEVAGRGAPRASVALGAGGGSEEGRGVVLRGVVVGVGAADRDTHGGADPVVDARAHEDELPTLTALLLDEFFNAV